METIAIVTSGCFHYSKKLTLHNRNTENNKIVFWFDFFYVQKNKQKLQQQQQKEKKTNNCHRKDFDCWCDWNPTLEHVCENEKTAIIISTTNLQLGCDCKVDHHRWPSRPLIIETLSTDHSTTSINSYRWGICWSFFSLSFFSPIQMFLLCSKLWWH